MAVRFLEVDGAKFKKAFEDRDLIMTKVSEEMGFDRSYLSGAIYAKKIRKSSVDYLEKIYNIPYEEYIPTPEDEEPLPWENPFGINDNLTYEPINPGAIVVTLSDETIEKIGNVIYEQVKRAWNE